MSSLNSKTMPQPYEPFRQSDSKWYFYYPDKYEPTTDKIVGPYEDEETCQRQANVTRQAMPLDATAGEGEV